MRRGGGGEGGANGRTPFDRLRTQVTQPCHEMLQTCKWRSLAVECDNLFNAALTDEGICCTFNRVRRDLSIRNP